MKKVTFKYCGSCNVSNIYWSKYLEFYWFFTLTKYSFCCMNLYWLRHKKKKRENIYLRYNAATNYLLLNHDPIWWLLKNHNIWLNHRLEDYLVFKSFFFFFCNYHRWVWSGHYYISDYSNKFIHYRLKIWNIKR